MGRRVAFLRTLANRGRADQIEHSKKTKRREQMSNLTDTRAAAALGKKERKMSGVKIDIVASVDVRRSLTDEGDLRADVAFQNDVNALLARVEQVAVPWRALSDSIPLSPARARTLGGIGLAPLVVERVLRATTIRRAGR
jgi:hypothetical protein